MISQEMYISATRTSTVHLTDPTSFPTVVPDPPIFQEAGATGGRTLWVVFVLMLLSTITFAALSWRVPASKRLYHSITTLMVLIATLSYYAMATGSGFSLRHFRYKENHDHGVPPTFRHVHREVYWVRYVDWLLTTPLLLVDLGLLAGLNGASLFNVIVADIIMILGGLFAAMTPNLHWTTYHKEPVPRLPAHVEKLGCYAIACLSFLWIIYTVLVTGIFNARAKGKGVSRFYTLIASYSVILWIAYPIIWAVADGTRHLSVDGEIVAYAILDLLAKVVFGAWLLYTHSRMPETHVTVGGFWAHGLNPEGRIRVGEEDEGA